MKSKKPVKKPKKKEIVIDSKNYKTFEDFLKALENALKKLFKRG